jgi:16S rRNA (cytidine1402-2'-O)-methyltransferase
VSRKSTQNTALDANSSRPGRLRLVATPIGNLEDITVRALRILRESHIVAAEDTRVTGKLLRHFEIDTRLISHHAHSGQEDIIQLITLLTQGNDVALVSDAGTPCISDPGSQLVRAAIDCGIIVEPIPGACAAIAAISASGLPTGQFTFEGFLPRSSDLKERLKALATERRTMIIYESPHRLADTLIDLAEAFGATRQATVAREVTKLHESFIRGTLAECAEHYKAEPPRGECVIIVEGGTGDAPERPEEVAVETLLLEAMRAGKSTKEAAREVANKTGLGRRELYATALKLQPDGDSEEG